MLNAPGAETFDVSSLRVVITGGASAAVETIRDYQKRMKGHLIELYGMLEAGFQTYTRFTDDPQKVNGTIGRPVRAMELRIVDAEGNDVPHGESRRTDVAWALDSSRLPQQSGRQRAGLQQRRLVPHRRSRPRRRCRRQCADYRPQQGDHQSRRQEILSARGRGDPLHPSRT